MRVGNGVPAGKPRGGSGDGLKDCGGGPRGGIMLDGPWCCPGGTYPGGGGTHEEMEDLGETRDALFTEGGG